MQPKPQTASGCCCFDFADANYSSFCSCYPQLVCASSPMTNNACMRLVLSWMRHSPTLMYRKLHLDYLSPNLPPTAMRHHRSFLETATLHWRRTAAMLVDVMTIHICTSKNRPSRRELIQGLQKCFLSPLGFHVDALYSNDLAFRWEQPGWRRSDVVSTYESLSLGLTVF